MTQTSNELKNFLCQMIDQSGGKISFADYMQYCLYHQEWGYYNKPQFEIGKNGDFTTASHISPLYARCFANFCIQVFESLPKKNILELGAGSGFFAYQMMQTLSEQDIHLDQYFIYEISPLLREKQKEFLQTKLPNLINRFIWLDSLPSNFEGIIIANEVLDALPVHCFEIQNGIKERCVAHANGELKWHLESPSNLLLTAIQKIQNKFDLPDHYQSEINLNVHTFLNNVLSALKKGIFIIADYGYGEAAYYHTARKQGTLTCFYKHHSHNNPFQYPGNQDITAHVNFSQVAETALLLNAEVVGFTTQAAFLLSLGLIDEAQKLEQKLSAPDQFQLHQSLKILTLPMEMGEIVKILVLGKKFDCSLNAFKLQDRRREL